MEAAFGQSLIGHIYTLPCRQQAERGCEQGRWLLIFEKSMSHLVDPLEVSAE